MLKYKPIFYASYNKTKEKEKIERIYLLYENAFNPNNIDSVKLFCLASVYAEICFFYWRILCDVFVLIYMRDGQFFGDNNQKSSTGNTR